MGLGRFIKNIYHTLNAKVQMLNLSSMSNLDLVKFSIFNKFSNIYHFYLTFSLLHYSQGILIKEILGSSFLVFSIKITVLVLETNLFIQQPEFATLFS